VAALISIVKGVAHEINTPIGNGITTASYMKMKNTKIKEAYLSSELTSNQFVEYIDIANVSMESLLRNLENAARIVTSFKLMAAEEKELYKTYVNLRLLITHCLEKHTENHNVNWQLSCPKTLTIYNDTEALEHVINNLISNTLTHAFVNNVEPPWEISVDCRTNNGYVEVDFQDNGIGVEEDVLDRIFEPLYTTNRSGGSVGLGMSIVHNIITRNLRGCIDLENADDGGLVVHLFIPMDQSIS